MNIYGKIVFIFLISAHTLHAMDNSQLTQRKKSKENPSVVIKSAPDTYLR